MDESRSRLLTLVVFPLVVVGLFFGYTHFFPPDPGAEPAATEAAQAVGGGAPDPGAAARRAAERREREREVTIETERYRATFTTLNTALTSFELKEPRFAPREGTRAQLVTTNQEAYYPFAIELAGVAIPEDAVWDVEEIAPNVLEFRLDAGGMRIARRIQPGDSPYQLWSTVRVENGTRHERVVRLAVRGAHYVARDDEGGGFIARPSIALSHGVCAYDDELVRKDREKLLEPHGYGPDVAFAAIENTYFATIFAPDGEAAERCQLRSSDRGATADDIVGSVFEARLRYARDTLAPGASIVHRTTAFIGPKDPAALQAFGHRAWDVVDLGWFSVIARALISLLQWIHEWAGNWGLAIILLTVLVRLALFPLQQRSISSMAEMRRLKPEIDVINQRFAGDQEARGAAMMELYRKHGINPLRQLGGCLPVLFQLPIWFALYQSLSTNIELYHAPFTLWWGDLSAPDPYYVLPLVLGGLTFLQQKITPNTMDPMQAKIMLYMMPIMITVFMLFLPAGLCVYMVTSSSLGIAQQQYTQYRLDKMSPPPPPPTGAGPDGKGSADSANTRQKRG